MKNSNGYIFVLMPFNKEFDDIYYYGIKKTCNDSNFYCERVDEQIFEGTILTRIYNQIQTADLIISDMSLMNPNVFYETGYAHALEKDVILLTQDTKDIPFDLKHYPHIIYNKNIKFLSEELTKKLNWYIENKEKNKEDLGGFIEIYNEGKIVNDGSKIIAKWIERVDEYEYQEYLDKADKR